MHEKFQLLEVFLCCNNFRTYYTVENLYFAYNGFGGGLNLLALGIVNIYLPLELLVGQNAANSPSSS